MSSVVETNRQKRPVTWIIATVIFLLVVVGLSIWAYINTRPEPAKATRRDIIAYVSLEGDVVAPPAKQANIRAPFGAPVAKVYTSVGDRVKKGDTLVELSYPSARQYYEQARQAVQAAETAYANAKHQFEAAVTGAKRQLQEARKAEKEAARPAPAAVAPSPAVSSNSTEDMSNQSTAQPQVSIQQIPSTDMEPFRQARLQAEQSVAQAQADMQAALEPYARDLAAARQALKDAQSGLKVAMVRAPISGSVLALNARAGQVVGNDPDVPVATIVDLDSLQLQAAIPAAQAPYVKPGLPVTIDVKDIPNEQFEGQVLRITTDVAEKAGGLVKDRGYVAVIHVENKNDLVKPGLKATASVKAGTAENALAVPNEAVDKDPSGRPVVKVLRKGQWQPVAVEVGLSDGRYTEIKTGLNEGETVQVTPELL